MSWTPNWSVLAIEAIGWISTAAFLLSIVLPKRVRLHELGMFTAVFTAIYGYAHGATAIWVKWIIAFFFHLWMWRKLRLEAREAAVSASSLARPLPPEDSRLGGNDQPTRNPSWGTKTATSEPDFRGPPASP